jgi:hypothetical protein
MIRVVSIVTGDFDRHLADAGIRRERSIRFVTPQLVGVAERMKRSIAEGITTILSQSGYARLVGGCCSTLAPCLPPHLYPFRTFLRS